MNKDNSRLFIILSFISYEIFQQDVSTKIFPMDGKPPCGAVA